MAKSKGLQYCPVFEKEGNRFIVCSTSFLAQSQENAERIGIATSMVECVFFDMRYTGETIEVSKGMWHVTADLISNQFGTLKIGVISGPLFDQVKEREIVQ